MEPRMGMALLPATAALDGVAAALDAPVTRYESLHDAAPLLRGGEVACVVVDAGAEWVSASRAVRRFRRESDAAIVLAVGPGDELDAAGVDATAVVDRTDPTATARSLEEVRADALLDRAASRSSAAAALLRETTESIRARSEQSLRELADEVNAAVAGTGPYPVGWFGRYDADKRVVRPIAAGGIPTSHLRAVPVENADTERDTAGDVSVTGRAVRSDGATDAADDAAVFTARLAEHRSVVDDDGTHVLALRIPTDPVVVLHLVADRPGGVPAAEREALADLGRAIAEATGESDASRVGEDQLRLLADMLAHELSNQLGAAGLQLDLAREQGGAEHFDYVERALDRIEGLTEETRALAREEPARERIDLGSVAESAWQAISTPNATLHVEDEMLEADPALLRLALVNLLRNAVEHGSASSQSESGDAAEGSLTDQRDAGEDEPPALRVEVGPLGDGAGFYVADDGTGIPPDERERVLEWGHSGGDGTGVGLGLVRLVAERHGWSVTVGESERGGARVELRSD
ncbi:MAG: sensor histidine kinase, partial [Haloglomus sp.]